MLHKPTSCVVRQIHVIQVSRRHRAIQWIHRNRVSRHHRAIQWIHRGRVSRRRRVIQWIHRGHVIQVIHNRRVTHVTQRAVALQRASAKNVSTCYSCDDEVAVASLVS